MSGIEIYKALTLLEHKLLSTILQLKQTTADGAGLGAVRLMQLSPATWLGGSVS